MFLSRIEGSDLPFWHHSPSKSIISHEKDLDEVEAQIKCFALDKVNGKLSVEAEPEDGKESLEAALDHALSLQFLKRNSKFLKRCWLPTIPESIEMPRKAKHINVQFVECA